MTLYATFKKTSPHYPGCVKLIHPSEDKNEVFQWAMGVMSEEYGDTWSHLHIDRSYLWTGEMQNLVNTFTYTND